MCNFMEIFKQFIEHSFVSPNPEHSTKWIEYQCDVELKKIIKDNLKKGDLTPTDIILLYCIPTEGVVADRDALNSQDLAVIYIYTYNVVLDENRLMS